jgi:hypothetical protein
VKVPLFLEEGTSWGKQAGGRLVGVAVKLADRAGNAKLSQSPGGAHSLACRLACGLFNKGSPAGLLARRPPHLAAANAARNDRQPPELQAHVDQSTRQQLAGPEAVRERSALLLSSSDTPRHVPPGETAAAAQLVRERDRLPFLSIVRIRP